MGYGNVNIISAVPNSVGKERSTKFPTSHVFLCKPYGSIKLNRKTLSISTNSDGKIFQKLKRFAKRKLYKTVEHYSVENIVGSHIFVDISMNIVLIRTLSVN